MGLLSFLFGRKKAPRESGATAVAPAEARSAAQSLAREDRAQQMTAGIQQAKLRLRMAVALRRGHHAAAYDAARQLAEIQERAGRRTAARIWSEQARIIETKLSSS